jgi:acid phosphatase family membrane protein YuiD
MMDALKMMLGSKRAIATVAGLAVALGAKLGLDLDNELVISILAAVAVFVYSQGKADEGKEAMKLEIEADERDAAADDDTKNMPDAVGFTKDD